MPVGVARSSAVSDRRTARGKADSDTVYFCGSSSVDRASAFQAEGREFEPRLPLQTQKRVIRSLLSVDRGVCVARSFCEMNF